jgi:hypothetical protein
MDVPRVLRREGALGAIGDLSHVPGPGKEKDEPKPDHASGNGVNQPPRGRGASWHAAVEATQRRRG